MDLTGDAGYGSAPSNPDGPAYRLPANRRHVSEFDATLQVVRARRGARASGRSGVQADFSVASWEERAGKKKVKRT
jgi:hypothetical protein